EAAGAPRRGAGLLGVELRALGPADTRRLLATVFPPGALPRAMRERIEAPAAGNPLFIGELLRPLIKQGIVEVETTGLRVTAGVETVEVPPTVQEVILSRVDRLAQ